MLAYHVWMDEDTTMIEAQVTANFFLALKSHSPRGDGSTYLDYCG